MPPSPSERKVAKRDARAERKTAARVRARKAAEEKAAMQEARDEDAAPAASRRAVVDAAGEVVREARVIRSGTTFVRSNPLQHMMLRGAQRAERGEAPLIEQRHVDAAKRLQLAWDLCGEGIGIGRSDFGAPRGSRGTAPAAPPGHEALVSQLRHRAEMEGAAAWLGSLWPVVQEVALRGVDVSAWSASVGMDRKAAGGYLRAALDRLVQFYAETQVTTSGRIRVIAPPREAQVIEVGG